MSDKYPWSDYQKTIFNEVATGEGHVIVDAVAGSGKTSSIIESTNHIPDGKSWLLVAFNKSIAEELNLRIHTFSGDVRTLHSLGLRSLFKKFPNIKVANDKVDKIMIDVVGKDKKLWDIKYQIKKTVSLCKAYMINGEGFIDHIMDDHDIDTFEMKRDIFIEKVQDILKECALNTKEVDFDDMIWMPLIHKVDVKKYDFTIIDECQDLNKAQLELAIKTCKRNGRIIALGDHKQAVYAFRGAGLDSISNLKKKLNAKSLPLSITYRCPKLVVKEAQKYTKQIMAAPDAKEGIVDHISVEQMLKGAQPGCFILSRINAPLVSHALNFIKRGIPASVQGKDIGKNLINLIKKSKKKELSSFLDWLFDWQNKEVARLSAKERNFEHIVDKAKCLRAVADSASSLSELKTKIIDLFEDTEEEDRIILSSVHRSKGLERDTVYLLWSTFRGGCASERNIKYVAVTRSAHELYYVT